MTVGQLLRQADSREIAEWEAYFLYEQEREEKEKQKKLDTKIKAGLAGAAVGGKSKN